jgi:hypothetical protein
MRWGGRQRFGRLVVGKIGQGGRRWLKILFQGRRADDRQATNRF